MKKLTPTNIALTFFAIILIGIFYRFTVLLYFPDSSIVLQKGELLQLHTKDSVTQTFVANRSNLAKIDFLMRTPGPKPEDTVTMQLADADCKNILRQGTLEPTFLNSDNLYEFQFFKIPDSDGKKYCVIATFKKGVSKYIRFFMTANQNPDFALTDTSGAAQYPDQSISLRPAYVNDTFFQDAEELNQRISQYKPFFLKHFYLSAIAILFVILSIGLIVILVTL